jgi:hypothetical protein
LTNSHLFPYKSCSILEACTVWFPVTWIHPCQWCRNQQMLLEKFPTSPCTQGACTTHSAKYFNLLSLLRLYNVV